MSDTRHDGEPQEPEAPAARRRWGPVAAVVASLAAVILLAVAIASGVLGGSLPIGGGGTTTTTVTLDEQDTEKEVPLCEELAAEVGGPVPGGSWVDVKAHLGDGRLQVAFAQGLRVDSVPASADEFTVTEDDLDDATCEADQIPAVTACRTHAPGAMHVSEEDVDIAVVLFEQEWVWQRFTYDGWAFVYDAFGNYGLTESDNLECCPDAAGGDSLPALPLPGETGCLPTGEDVTA